MPGSTGGGWKRSAWPRSLGWHSRPGNRQKTGPRPYRQEPPPRQPSTQPTSGQFTHSFDAVFTADGIRILASPPQAPRANAICERIIGTLRRELLDRMLIVNEHHLHQVLTSTCATAT